MPWKLIAIDRGEPVPTRADEFAGLCLMGGPMSVNDPLPWIDPLCALIRDAVDRGIQVLGHCLGGQLMSKALGGRVGPNAVKEIGWGEVRVVDGSAARHWFGDRLAASDGRFTVFHWHGETFSLPDGAERILESDACANQMFALGPHLAMQCHIEMTPEMIATWCRGWREEVRSLAEIPPSVQTPEAMQAGIEAKLPDMRRLADQIYSVWIEGLGRG